MYYIARERFWVPDEFSIVLRKAIPLDGPTTDTLPPHAITRFSGVKMVEEEIARGLPEYRNRRADPCNLVIPGEWWTRLQNNSPSDFIFAKDCKGDMRRYKGLRYLYQLSPGVTFYSGPRWTFASFMIGGITM